MLLAEAVLVALRTTAAMTLDGALDEPAWENTVPVSGFRQIDPANGEPATLDTEVRILFDDRVLYVGAVCHDPAGSSGLRVPDLRRDFDSWEHDHFGVSIDPFGDGRVAVAFEVNPYGAVRDLMVFEDILQDRNWDAVWRAKTRRGRDGWTAEIAIPWASVRYPRGEGREWRINFVREARRLNELSGWSPWPRGNNVYRMSYAGHVTGLEPPRPSLNLQVVPYSLGRAGRAEAPGVDPDDDVEPDAGLDVKWAPSTDSVVDLTVNTDFAQADADRQVVNLSRFSVFFPERRGFFLESASLFTVGYLNTFYPFFSRRIGLGSDGKPIPLDGGARWVRRTPERSMGAFALHTRAQDGTPGTVFAVSRVSENIGERARIGSLVVLRRDEAKDGLPASLNVVPSVDGFFRFGKTMLVESTLSGSGTEGPGGDGLAGVLDVYSRGPLGSIGNAIVLIDDDYLPRTGFVRRSGTAMVNPYAEVDLRPSWKPDWVRAFRGYSFAEIYHGMPEGEFQDGFARLQPFGVLFESGDYLGASVMPAWSVLDQPFSPLPGVVFQPGRYRNVRAGVEAGTDQSRKLGFRAEATRGGYYSGNLDTFFVFAFARPIPHIAFAGSYEHDEIRDAGTVARADLIAPELRLALNPRVQLVVFWQKSTAEDLESWNVRFSWEFRPLSNLYVVYTDTAIRPEAPVPWSRDRQLVLKLTWAWQT